MNKEEISLAKRVLVRLVAKAICKSNSCQGINCCQWPGNGGRHGDWNRLRRECPAKAGGYDNAALDAIVAYQSALGIEEEDGCGSE